MSTTILTDEQKAQFVTDITDYGTGFVAPLFAVVESIEQAVLQSEQVQAWKKDAERFSEAFDLLKTLFEAWENGPACYNHGDRDDYIGNAFTLDDKTFRACVAMLNGRSQADAATKEQP